MLLVLPVQEGAAIGWKGNVSVCLHANKYNWFDWCCHWSIWGRDGPSFIVEAASSIDWTFHFSDCPYGTTWTESEAQLRSFTHSYNLCWLPRVLGLTVKEQVWGLLPLGNVQNVRGHFCAAEICQPDHWAGPFCKTDWTENPETCPHGRPISKFFEHKDLAKFFQRNK